MKLPYAILALSVLGSMQVQYAQNAPTSAEEIASETLKLTRVDYNSTSRLVTFILHNKGKQSIAAFQFHGVVHYASGVEKSFGEFTDLLPLLALQEAWGTRPLDPTNSSLGPGEEYSYKYDSEPGFVSGEIVVTAVVFQDCSAVGDEGAIGSVFQHRIDAERGMKAAVAVVNKAKAEAHSHDELVKILCDQAAAARHPLSVDLTRFCQTLDRQGDVVFDRSMQAFEIQANAYGKYKERRF